MKKKMLYICGCLIILIASLFRYFKILEIYPWYEVATPIIVYLIFSYCLLYSDKVIVNIHWYMHKKSINDFSDSYILLMKLGFGFGVLFGSVLPLFLSGPIVI